MSEPAGFRRGIGQLEWKYLQSVFRRASCEVSGGGVWGARGRAVSLLSSSAFKQVVVSVGALWLPVMGW